MSWYIPSRVHVDGDGDGICYMHILRVPSPYTSSDAGSSCFCISIKKVKKGKYNMKNPSCTHIIYFRPS